MAKLQTASAMGDKKAENTVTKAKKKRGLVLRPRKGAVTAANEAEKGVEEPLGEWYQVS